jgi:Spy/CpxP family protein refolding chaperone
MNTFNFMTAIIFVSTSLAAQCVAAQQQQQQQHHHHSHDSTATPNAATPYAGQQLREIKSLSNQEQQDLLEGKGMGLAKAAELNGFPGPMHTLEHAEALKLSAEQKSKTQGLLQTHKSAVKALGKQLVEVERALDLQFSSAQITSETLTQLTQKIGQLQAQIRAEHLKTHLEQTALLTKSQIEQYGVLRGYLQ